MSEYECKYECQCGECDHFRAPEAKREETDRKCNCGKLESEHVGKHKYCPNHPYTFNPKPAELSPEVKQEEPLKGVCDYCDKPITFKMQDGSTAHPYIAAPAESQGVKRAQPVEEREIERPVDLCPKCGAHSGAMCHLKSGRELKNFHEERRRIVCTECGRPLSVTHYYHKDGVCAHPDRAMYMPDPAEPVEGVERVTDDRPAETIPDFWRCFHCDFHTTSHEEAEAHFGERDDAEEFKPICKWWARMDEAERRETLQDTIRDLRREQEETVRAETRIEVLEAALRDVLHIITNEPELDATPSKEEEDFLERTPRVEIARAACKATKAAIFDKARLRALPALAAPSGEKV